VSAVAEVEGVDTPSGRPTAAREIPERVFRSSEDWKWLQAARRERRRQEMKARVAALKARWRSIALAVLVVAALVVCAMWLAGGWR